MTYGDVITKARELARVSVHSLATDRALELVSEAILDFSRDVGGFRYVRRLQVVGLFVPETFEGFNLKIVGSTNNDIDSDIAVTSSDSGDKLSGTAMAAMLQTQIRTAIGASADLTVTWANFYFTIDGIDSTEITIDSPDSAVTYVDAVTKYFGGGSSGTTSITGDFPKGCTIGSPLKDNFRGPLSVAWGGTPLSETSESFFVGNGGTGTPACYYVDNWSYLLLYPVPTTQKDLSISYEGNPDLEDSPVSTTELPTELPAEYHGYIAYKMAEELLLGTFEDDLADRRRYEYQRGVDRYNVRKANRNTEARAGLLAHSKPYYVVGG